MVHNASPSPQKYSRPTLVLAGSGTRPGFQFMKYKTELAWGMSVFHTDEISRYMTPYSAPGMAIRGQPRPHIYFERPLRYYFNLGFRNGLVLDGFEECAFPASGAQKHPLSWGGSFSEIPPILVARLRRPRFEPNYQL